MWSLPWSPWGSWSGQDKEQTKAGGGQRSHLGVKYYQRSISEKESPIAGETVGMDKRKLKPPGGPSGNAELDDGWRIIDEEELQVITTCKCKGRNSSILTLKNFRLL